MSKTTIKKLQRLESMVEAEAKGGVWYVNPKKHPHPTLPDQAYLEGEYLAVIEKSCPSKLERVRELVALAGKEGRG
jgi:hypothetical protein